MKIKIGCLSKTMKRIKGAIEMSLQTWFEKGLTPKEYMDTLEKHKDGFHAIYDTFSVPTDTIFTNKNIRAIVLAEPWCGHCMLNIPILLRIAEHANFDVRFLLRDENLELMDQYLTNGKSRTIPIVIFIDENGEEVGKWGPLADYTKTFMAPLRANLPEKGSPAYDEKFQEMITFTAKAFSEDEKIWNGVYDSITETIRSI